LLLVYSIFFSPNKKQAFFCLCKSNSNPSLEPCNQ